MTMSKLVEIKMSNGEKYLISLNKIIMMRINRLAKKNTNLGKVKEFTEDDLLPEYNEIFSFISEYLSWEDIKKYAKKVKEADNLEEIYNESLKDWDNFNIVEDWGAIE